MKTSNLTLKQLLLAVSMSGLVATVHAAPIDNADAAYDKGDYAQALKIWKSRAAEGDVVAQYNLGMLYDTGRGVAQSDQEALKWFRLAAEKGNSTAQFNVGTMYDTGRGIAQNNQEALKWFRLSAEKGNASAQNNLGWMYHYGRGVTQSNQEALKWYKLAAAQGHQAAITNLKTPMMRAAQNATTYSPMTDQPKRTAPKIQISEGVSPPRLVFSSSAPRADGSVKLTGRVISASKISEVSINDHPLEVSLDKDNSFRVIRLPAMGAATSYRLSVTDEFGQMAVTEISVERAATQ